MAVGTKRAVVLFSGGLDSATVAAIARAEGWELYALTVSYGQRHIIEVAKARALAEHLGFAEHRVMDLDLAAWGGSTLTGAAAAADAHIEPAGIPATYVPARNTILLSLALAWAEVLDARAVFLGISAVDYSGYPDCRPAFVAAFQSLAHVATRAGVAGHAPEIRAPLIEKSKADTILWGRALGLDYGLTWSCYDPRPEGKPCGDCDSCRLRAKGFAQAGLQDPLTENS